jgi:hypothetical protein
MCVHIHILVHLRVLKSRTCIRYTHIHTPPQYVCVSVPTFDDLVMRVHHHLQEFGDDHGQAAVELLRSAVSHAAQQLCVRVCVR